MSCHVYLLIPYSNFFVWTEAARNKHYLVSLASLMLLMTLTFQPLAAALFVVKDTYWGEPGEPTTITDHALQIRQLMVVLRHGSKYAINRWAEPECTIQ